MAVSGSTIYENYKKSQTMKINIFGIKFNAPNNGLPEMSIFVRMMEHYIKTTILVVLIPTLIILCVYGLTFKSIVIGLCIAFVLIVVLSALMITLNTIGYYIMMGYRGQEEILRGQRRIIQNQEQLFYIINRVVSDIEGTAYENNSDFYVDDDLDILMDDGIVDYTDDHISDFTKDDEMPPL